MAYIGKSIESGTFSVLDTSGNTYNGSNVTFNLGTQVGSVAQLLVSHDGVIQKPGTDYTLATGGTQITFTTAPASGASIFIVEISGAVGGPLDSDLNGTELILDADGDTSLHASTDDQIDVKIAGADDFSFTANTFTAAAGSSISSPDYSGGAVFNEGSADVDFRVESNGKTHALFVDGGNDKVGIGIVAGVPDAMLHIQTDGAGQAPNSQADELAIEGSGHVGMSILSGNDSKGNIYFGDNGDDDIGSITYHHDGNSMRFTTNASEAVRIDTNGHVGIGTTAPGNTTLVVSGEENGNNICLFDNTHDGGAYGPLFKTSGQAPDNNSLYFLTCADSGTVRMRIYSDGDLVNHDNSYGAISDERIKQNITDSGSQWDDIKAIKVRKYKLKDDVRKYGENAWEQIGVISQELETAGMNKLVNECDPASNDIESDSSFGTLYTEQDKTDNVIPDGKDVGDIKEIKTQVKNVKYSLLYMKAIKALQEAMAKIETLETKVKALEDA